MYNLQIALEEEHELICVYVYMYVFVCALSDWYEVVLIFVLSTQYT